MTRRSDVRRALKPLDGAFGDPAFWSLGPRPAPVDIACELARAMDVGRFTRRGKTWVQTVYTAELADEDLERYADRKQELVATLKDTLEWWAREHRYALPGALRVRVTGNPELNAGQLAVEAGLRREEAAKLGRVRRGPES